jgi:ketosteroid isomerase-like protein
MVDTKQGLDRKTVKEYARGSSTWKAMVIGLAFCAAVGLGYLAFKRQVLPTSFLVPQMSSSQPSEIPTGSQTKPVPADVRLTREGIDLLLDTLDEAIRRKDVDAVVRHITSDATITIHMKQGSHQQVALLTREEYRKTLAMAFAFPSANDFTRTTTTVSVAADEQSAKVSFKSTETLLQANREFKTEGEETLLFNIRDGKPMITSLEQTFPGDST